jgi:hypothetical protein
MRSLVKMGPNTYPMWRYLSEALLFDAGIAASPVRFGNFGILYLVLAVILPSVTAR